MYPIVIFVDHDYKCTPCGCLAGEYDTVRNDDQYKVQALEQPIYNLSTATMGYNGMTKSTPPPCQKGTRRDGKTSHAGRVPAAGGTLSRSPTTRLSRHR